MATELPHERRVAYSAIIDSILVDADLETISAKAIRKALQEQVEDDLASEKQAITELIMARFDKVQRERLHGKTRPAAPPAPTTNGAAHEDTPALKQEDVAETVEAADDQPPASPPPSPSPSPSPSHKRKAEPDSDSDILSDIADTPPPKKAKKAPPKPKAQPKAKLEPESDEQMAKRLQAEFSASTGRSTRGGGATKKKPTAIRKQKMAGGNKKKAKSAAKINSDDDSAVEAHSPRSPKAEREKKGGFHKLMNLSEPLQALLGETQLSRPQTVKKIWEYVKERDLQDPGDKRQIRCNTDDLMQAVFKVEKVHMFTMNKVLAGQLWPVEEV
ncbi:hypothetical protein LTR08_007525 [Meristemomyces frigidus]|nr:hypothetical protein LTR08_007525 [Meristemomyces frigidus]